MGSLVVGMLACLGRSRHSLYKTSNSSEAWSLVHSLYSLPSLWTWDLRLAGLGGGVFALDHSSATQSRELFSRQCFRNFPDGKNNGRCLEDRWLPRPLSCKVWVGVWESVSLMRTSDNFFHQEVWENILIHVLFPPFFFKLLLHFSKYHKTATWLLPSVMLLLSECLLSRCPHIHHSFYTPSPAYSTGNSVLITIFLFKEYLGCSFACRIISGSLSLGLMELCNLFPACLYKFFFTKFLYIL